MAEEIKNTTTRDLMGFLDHYFVKKAPFQIPENAKEWIVKYGPWINIVILILLLPLVLAFIGFSSLLGSYAIYSGGYTYGMLYWVGVIFLLFQFLLQSLALPGLFARKMSGWKLIFYSEIVSVVSYVIAGNIIGALVGALIGFYVLFQIREKYAK